MIGKTISHYQITRQLGAGGMGVVYEAVDTKLDRTVALKFLPPESTRDPDAKARFVHEAKAASAIDHPNVCNIYEIDETDDGQLFLAMACYMGETLKEKIGRGPLPIDEALDITRQAAEGLAKAHELNIVHRDIKPANIFVTNDGLVKILDFGLVKLSSQTMLTKTGVTMGTISYISPEQFKGEDVDQRSDIWALGVVLYEMITGEVPFRGDYEQAVMYSILNKAMKPVRSSRSELPTDVECLIGKLLSKDTNERYQASTELVTALKSLIQRSEVKAGGTDSEVKKLLPSIAVLPFTNMSTDPDNQYFGDGLSEELINALTQIEDLRVAARTSTFRFRGEGVDIREIGEKLNVGFLLEGSVRRAGGRLRVTAQLINISDGYHLWSERYDREMDDIFAIQDEITAAIVKQLQVELVGKQKEMTLKRHTENLEAYDQYLKGIYYWNKFTPDGFERSSECFEKAIGKDPHYALAFAGLADSYWMSSIWGNLPPRQTYPKAREAAKRAIEIDDTLGEAHASLGSIHTFYDWDWEAAEREFKRAIELTPGSSYTRVYYSFYLNLRRRHDEAIIQARKAKELDPISSCSAHLGHRLWQARRYDEAIEEFQKWLVIEPNDWFAHHHLGELYLAKSMIKEAIAEIDKAVELSGGVPLNVALAVMAHYRFGDKEVAERLFDSLKKRASNEYIQPMCFIIIYQTRGEMDQVFEWVKRAWEERDSFLPWHRVTPVDYMHFPSDPRIDELLDRLGLP